MSLILNLTKIILIDTELLKRISIDPEIFNGTPIIRGIRFTVTDILDLLSAGMSTEEIVNDFPFLEKMISGLHYCMHLYD